MNSPASIRVDLLVSALLVAGPVFAAEIAVTPANFAAKFAEAKPGDVLKPVGSFGVVVIQGRTFDSPIFVDASRATFQAVVIKSVNGLAWTGGKFVPANGRTAISVSDSRSVTFDGIVLTADGRHGGVIFRDSQDVALTNSRLDRPRVGVTTVNVARARIVGNSITGWTADGIGLNATSDSLISRNKLLDPVRIDEGIHIDGIQGYFNGATPNRNLIVSFNTVRGSGTQGIVFNTVPGWPAPQKITLESNEVALDAANGVTLMGDPAGVVRNNHATTLPGARWMAQVYVSDPRTARCGNSAAAYQRWKATADIACKND